MAFTDPFVFALGLLLVVSIVAAVPAERSGVPLLLVFLIVGMLAGEQGPGGIEFESVGAAHLIGTLALAIILFDGGLHTPLSSFRTGLAPGLALATLGVGVTALITAVAAAVLFGMALAPALLLAAMISSTDAAAVFYLLRARGMELHARVRNTLEIESGVNDPLAIFLTIGLIQWLTHPAETGVGPLLQLFVVALIVGVAGGLAVGLLLVSLVNRVALPRALAPLLVLGGGLLAYGAAALAGGSGFLAAYLAGLVVGHRTRVERRGIQRFHDGMAWLCQIGLFLLLGLLVTPTALLPLAPQALALGAVLLLIARPAAVTLCLWPLRFPWRQIAFVSWVGLRGAVPIVLSLFPLLAEVDGAARDFNVVFFVVLVSLLLQGWSVAPAARALGLQLPRQRPAASRMDVAVPANHELVALELPPDCPATHGTLGALAPPQGVQTIGLLRDHQPLPVHPRRSLQPWDILYLLVPSGDGRVQERLDRWLDSVGTTHPVEEAKYFGELTVDGGAAMEAFAGLYLRGGVADARPHDTLDDYLRRRLRHRASEGDQVRHGGVVLVVREIDGDRITKIGVRLPRQRPAVQPGERR